MEALILTKAGRPSLREGEVECLVCPGGKLEREGHAHACTVVITSLRVLFVEVELSFDLVSLAHVRVRPAGLFGRARTLDVQLQSGVVAEAPSASEESLAIAFKTSAVCEQFRAQLAAQQQRALDERRRLLEQQSAAAATQLTTTHAGISGIIRAQEHADAAAERSVGSAFADLQALMAHAKEMVQIAQRLAASRDRASVGSREDDEDEQNELERFRLFGIASPVTRASHGAVFHRELARQLCDFLVKPLEASRGVLALTDVFCIFNRARGTALVSPADLLQACELLPQLALPMRLLRFSSGVLAVRLVRANADDDLEARIVRLACTPRGVTAIEVGLQTGISLLLASEFLLTLEAQRRLCRDGKRRDSLAFYPNIFADTADARRALAALRATEVTAPG